MEDQSPFFSAFLLNSSCCSNSCLLNFINLVILGIIRGYDSICYDDSCPPGRHPSFCHWWHRWSPQRSSNKYVLDAMIAVHFLCSQTYFFQSKIEMPWVNWTPRECALFCHVVTLILSQRSLSMVSSYIHPFGRHVWIINIQSNVLSLWFTAFDVSADLTELGQTPVAVICSGAKSILDIELTLEYLVSIIDGCLSIHGFSI